ncbi:MAG: glycosyl hydrolase family 28-related protein [Polyangiales bacterium]
MLVAVLALSACDSTVPADDSTGDPPPDDVGNDGFFSTDTSDAAAQDAGAQDAGAQDAGAQDAGAQDAPPEWRSVLYPEDWTPDFTAPDGAFLHDFSYAGAFSGGPLPEGSALRFDVREFGADPTGRDDSGPAIQGAIDAASAEGGVVWVPAGTYQVTGKLRVDASHVIIRGAGPSSRVHFTQSEGMTNRAHLLFAGRGDEGNQTRLVNDAPVRGTFVEVESTEGLEVGDQVAIGFVITPGFIERHGMTGTWVSFNDQYKHFYRRSVVRIDEDSRRVHLDVPLRDDVLVSDGAELRVLRGLIHDVGLENIALSNAASQEAAESVDRTHIVRMEWVVDSWIRSLTSFAGPNGSDEQHLLSGGVKVLNSHRVTVRESELQLAQNRGGGGNGYLFEVSMSNEVLFADDVARRGRHNFIQNWDFGTSGVVWLRCQSLDGVAINSGIALVGLSEFHHSLATANLIDSNYATDGWSAVNRGDYSSGAGLSAKENVFWNHRGGRLQSFQFGLGFIIGTQDVDVRTELGRSFFGEDQQSAPQDYVEGVGAGGSLTPASLYEDQLRRRLSR